MNLSSPSSFDPISPKDVNLLTRIAIPPITMCTSMNGRPNADRLLRLGSHVTDGFGQTDYPSTIESSGEHPQISNLAHNGIVRCLAANNLKSGRTKFPGKTRSTRIGV